MARCFVEYVAFGLLQAAAMIYETSTKGLRKRISKKINSSVYQSASVILTFSFVTFSLIIFRSETFNEGMYIITGMFSKTGPLFYDNPSTLLFMLLGCLTVLVYDLQQEFTVIQFSLFSDKAWLAKQIAYAILLISVLVAGVFDGGQFIYFSF